MRKIRLATVWLDGCSGCHMSLLDMDAGIIALLRKVDLVYGPLVDVHEFPEEVDVTLVEGAISSQDDVAMIQRIRQRTRTLVALGDCAVTGNVPSMRNTIPVHKLLHHIYVNGAQENRVVPSDRVPTLLKQARPVHELVRVDVHVPGCPPSTKAIAGVLSDLVEGRRSESTVKLRFG